MEKIQCFGSLIFWVDLRNVFDLKSCVLFIQLFLRLIDWLILWSVFSFAVIQSLLDLISEPEPDHPLRTELAEEFTKDKKKFLKNAEDFTKKHAEKRPEWFFFLELTHVIPRDSATGYFLVLFTVAFLRMFF